MKTRSSFLHASLCWTSLALVFGPSAVDGKLWAAPPPGLQPELVFRDTFDVSTPSDDVNFENAQRQSGTTAPLTYAGAANPAQLGQPDAAGQLRLPSSSYVSPNHNFVEGGQFTIEFDVDPGIDDDPADGLSGDWCAIVFGATAQNVFVNGSDGMGILFRNGGAIEVWETGAQGSIYSGPGDVTIPTDRPFHVKIEVDTADFKGSPATVRMFIDDQQARIDRNSLEHVKPSGFRGNFITLEGLGFPGPWVHVFDNLSVSAVPCITTSPDFVNTVKGETSEFITVGIPVQANATQAAAVKVKSLDPLIAVPVGADASGTLTLNFAAGAPRTQTFAVTGLKGGATTMVVEGPEGVCSFGRVQVTVAAGVALSEVVLADSFDVSSATTDVNFENGGGRQSGTAGVVNYAERAEHAAGGAADEFTAINQDAGPGKLYLRVIDMTWVSPDYHFIDGGTFKIEFDVDPSVLDPDRTTDDWAAVVFGASTRGPWVNGSDGIGILFRSNGGYQVFDGGALAANGAAGSLPAGELKVRIEVETANFSGTVPATVALFVNDQQVPIGVEGLTYTKLAGFRGNFVTLEGYAAAGNDWTYAFDNLKISADACVHASALNLVLAPGQETADLTIKVPQAFNQGKSGKVVLTSRNPGVAALTGAVGGELTLDFASGGPVTQTVQVKAMGAGQTWIDLANDQGVCVGDPVLVQVRRAFIANPSFESNYNPGWPHYSGVDGWTQAGGGGVNDASGPFQDNGAVPDRARIAFIQGNGSLSQTIDGLTPGKQYWVQLRYNARGCCGGAVPDLTVRFDGIDIGSVPGVQPVGGPNPYYARSFTFTPQNASGVLEIAANVAGDATLLVDAVTVVQRDEGNVAVQNPSFEASGTRPATGLLAPAGLSGWVGEGNYGVDMNGGAFADNGSAPDQDLVAFIQGPGALSQTLVGLLPGQNYTVTYAYNARSGNRPHLRVTAGDAVIADTDVEAVGGGAGYRVGTGAFQATANTAMLRFAQTAGGDEVVLLDNVKVVGLAVNIPCIEVAPARLALGPGLTDSSTTVKIPGELVANAPAKVTVVSLDPTVAVLEGAVDGILTLDFAPGGELVQAVTVRGVRKGATQLAFANPHGVCFNRENVAVTVLGSFVRNPSFEDNSHPQFPGYGPIDAWSSEGPGNTGINGSGGPFHDNGIIPDRAQVALLQVDKAIRETIVGLTPGKQYWLQFYYNVRNCCGGAIDLSVKFEGVEIASILQITPVGGQNPYNFQQAVFTPAGGSGVLEFSTVSVGDATVLLDGVNIVQRDANQVVIVNPSFEASGVVPFPGYIQPNQIAGWAGGGGGRGANLSGPGPFADNGVNPDQDSVAFLQGQGTFIRQTITGLTPGTAYTLQFAVNARGGNAPRLKVSWDDQTLLEDDVLPVGGSNPYEVKAVGFTAAGSEGVLRFEETAPGDNTVLLDNVTIVPGAGPAPRPKLSVRLDTDGSARLSWPSSVTDFILQGADAVTGAWVDLLLPARQEGNEWVVNAPVTGAAKFFRLKKQ